MYRTCAGIALGACIFGSAAGQTNGPASTASPPAASEPAGTPSAGRQVMLSAEDALTYKLGTGDKLHIITFDEPQLTGDFYVGSDGTVSLPWIGSVPARGRTEADLRQDIEARLKKGYIVDPTVSLQVMAYRPFYILGEVNKPGQYPYIDGLTLLGAVATAGGFTYRANTRKVFVKHFDQPVELKERITPTTEVRAGDTIRITQRYF